jgi:nitrite reductase/ring-hydroxylating ferredoxin subunit
MRVRTQARHCREASLKVDIVRCRIHHWRFCVRNGTYLDEAKPSCNVRNYPTRVVGEQVQIELDNTSLLNRNPQQDLKPT